MAESIRDYATIHKVSYEDALTTLYPDYKLRKVSVWENKLQVAEYFPYSGTSLMSECVL
jgi:hypothetical protein